MTRCASCHQTRGKRQCPALNDLICPLCCGEKRIIEIDCPDDCTFLKAGEAYHRERRSEKAIAAGKNYVSERFNIVKDREALNFIVAMEHTLHMHRTANTGLTDETVLRAIEELPLHLGKVQAVISSSQPLALFLAEKIRKDELFVTYRNLPTDRLKLYIDSLKGLAEKRSNKGDSATSYLDFIATYFSAMISEREILKEMKGPEKEDLPNTGESPGGIILP